MKILIMILLSALTLIFMVGCQQGEEGAENPTAGTTAPIIDVHMHAYPVRGPAEWMTHDITTPLNDEQNLQETLEIMDQNSLTR
jgi:hypothetical protein